MIRRPKARENLSGPGIWVPPALTGNLVARLNECTQGTLAFVVGEMRCERLVGCIDLDPLADALRGISSVVADHPRMIEHDLAQRRLIDPEVGLAPGLDVPLNLEHERHWYLLGRCLAHDIAPLRTYPVKCSSPGHTRC